MPGRWWSKRKVQEQLQTTMDAYPFLRQRTANTASAPYRLVIEATHRVEGSKFVHAVGQMSYHVIPSTERRSFELEGRVYRNAEKLRTYEAAEFYQTRRQILFLATPWLWRPSLSAEAMQDAFRRLFQQIQTDAATLFVDAAAG